MASSQVDVQQCSHPWVQGWEAATDEEGCSAMFRAACVGRVEGGKCGRSSSHDCVDGDADALRGFGGCYKKLQKYHGSETYRLHSSSVAWKAVPAVPGLFLDAENDEILEDSLSVAVSHQATVALSRGFGWPSRRVNSAVQLVL